MHMLGRDTGDPQNGEASSCLCRVDFINFPLNCHQVGLSLEMRVYCCGVVKGKSLEVLISVHLLVLLQPYVPRYESKKWSLFQPLSSKRLDGHHGLGTSLTPLGFMISQGLMAKDLSACFKHNRGEGCRSGASRHTINTRWAGHWDTLICKPKQCLWLGFSMED